MLDSQLSSNVPKGYAGTIGSEPLPAGFSTHRSFLLGLVIRPAEQLQGVSVAATSPSNQQAFSFVRWVGDVTTVEVDHDHVISKPIKQGF